MYISMSHRSGTNHDTDVCHKELGVLSKIVLMFFPWHLCFADFVKGWYLCQLEVLECKKVAWPRSEIESTYNIEDCGWPLKDFAYECQINLLTGRTHQVFKFHFPAPLMY